MIRDYGDKLPEDARTKTQQKISEVNQALQGTDSETLRRTTDELVREVQNLGAAMYQSGQGSAAGPDGGPQPGPSAPGGEDVVEGEVVD